MRGRAGREQGSLTGNRELGGDVGLGGPPRSWALVLAAVLAAGLLTACNTHTGKVIDAMTGQLLEGVTVAAADSTGRVVTTTTDDKGQYILNLPGGDTQRHALTFDAPGYVAVTLPPTSDSGQQRDAALVPDATPGDTDGDNLTDGEEAVFGTVIDDPDTDADGLPDGIEAKVTSPFGAPGVGVSPLHKDLLLEIDWAASSRAARPTALEVSVVTRSFARAPVPNPDGTTGIRLVVDTGTQGGGGSLTLNPAWDCGVSLDDPPQPVVDGLEPARRPYWFHAVSVDRFDCSLFGYAQLPGRLFVYAGNQARFGIAAPFVLAGVIQHEFGHNLGLRHGGDVDTGCKPNYPSVMNYNPLLGLGFDYSRGEEDPLDEAALDEATGAGFGPVDWNLNGRIDSQPVVADINNFEALGLVGKVLQQFFSPDRCPVDGVIEELRDFDDWGNIDLRPPVADGTGEMKSLGGHPANGAATEVRDQIPAVHSAH